MKELLRPFAIVLAVPLLVTALGMLGRSDWESRWNASVAAQMARQGLRPDQRFLAQYSLANVCADRRIGPRFVPCRTYNLFSAVISASALVGGVGLGLLGAFVLVGRACRERRWLERLFGPSLVFVAGGTAALGAAHGLLAIAAVVVGAIDLSGESVEQVSGSLVVVAAAAFVGWAIAMGAVAFDMVRRPKISVVGARLDPAGQPRLADVVGEVAASVGASAPSNLVACLVPWLFVTEMDVSCLDGRLRGRTLCLSLPLCRILSVGEFKALLAHELAHFAPAEEAFSARVLPAVAGVSRGMHDLAARSRGVRAAVFAPPLALMGVFMEAVGPGAIPGDERERLADQAAAASAGTGALAAALVKLAAFAPAWHAVAVMMQHAVGARTQFVNAGALFQEIASANAGRDRLDGAEALAQGHPTDRLPALAARLAAIHASVGEVASDALTVLPAMPASMLIEDGEATERRLTTAEHYLLVETGGEFRSA